MRLFGESEAAARLPSAVLGTLSVPLLWMVVRRRFGEAAGLAAAAVLALTPLHVAHSRSARFYAGFALAYGMAALLGMRALETGSRRTVVVAAAVFVVALHLQFAAVMLVAPLLASAAWSWLRASGRERRTYGRRLSVLASLVAAAITVLLVAGVFRNGTFSDLRRPVPGVELRIGFEFGTVSSVLGVVSPWAWLPLGAAVIAAGRRSPGSGRLALHLILPMVLVAMLFRPDASRIDPRYLLHLEPFVAALAGVGAAEIARRLADSIRRLRSNSPVHVRTGAAVAAAVVAAASVAGVTNVWTLPGRPHPGGIILRPNWNAAALLVRPQMRPGDGLLSTGPLATAWVLGRCGDWLRNVEKASPFMFGERDVYCGSRLVPDVAAVMRYVAANPRGWVVADARAWRNVVDPEARSAINRIATRVAVGDDSILVYRWGFGSSLPSFGNDTAQDELLPANHAVVQRARSIL